LKLDTIKIIYLIGQLGLGGSERQLYLLLKHMDITRFEPQVVVFNPSANYTLDDDLRRAGVSVHPIPPTVRGIPARMAWLYRFFRQLRPHVVHSWSIHDNAYAGLVGWLAGVPLRLGSVRGSIGSPDFRQFSRLIQWLILHSVQAQVVNSASIVADLRAAGVPATGIFLLPNCVETGAPGPQAELPANFPHSGRIIGMVANLRSEKNHLLFVRALARLLPEFPDLYGVMVGQPVRASDPDVPEQVQAAIERLGAGERIRLVGFHPYPPALLPRFEVFCLPSDFEGTPNAVLEAMAAGLPVVATNVGGIPQVIEHGINGLLVPPRDEDALAAALRDLLLDPAAARQMGQAARQRVERGLSPQVIVPQLEAYYDSQPGKSR
jgi:glycosyltransferase involved in cell wall biosynthesis